MMNKEKEMNRILEEQGEGSRRKSKMSKKRKAKIEKIQRDSTLNDR